MESQVCPIPRKKSINICCHCCDVVLLVEFLLLFFKVVQFLVRWLDE